MILLLTGASHTGKTALSQRLLEKYKIPYLSIDHLKMGLIRSGETPLTPEDDEELTSYLWPIVREIVKTAVENRQHLVVEGCYIPFDWQKDFEPEYLDEIQYCCLVMTAAYIKTHYSDIQRYANVVERRPPDDDTDIESVLRENAKYHQMCRRYNCRYLLIDDDYDVDIDLPLPEK